jgi:hypothetical protein
MGIIKQRKKRESRRNWDLMIHAGREENLADDEEECEEPRQIREKNFDLGVTLHLENSVEVGPLPIRSILCQ